MPTPNEKEDRRRRDAGAPVSASGQPQAPQMGSNPQAAGMIRYPTENPRFALQSAIQDMGGNPFRADPYLGMLMNSAQGLASSFMLNNLGTDASGIAGQGGEGAMFGKYLQGVLGESGGIGSTLAGANSQMGSYLGQLTDIQNQMASGGGGGLQNVNPFAQYIMDQMANPGGAAGLQASLTTPFMGRSVGQAYTGGLQDVAGQALRQRGQDLNQSGLPRNFWDYLFPGL